MTERLYYTDSYLRHFTAAVTSQSADGRTVYLDRTAFYPTSGGQPFDTGTIGGVAVLEVADEGEEIAHLLADPLERATVDCSIDWDRRFDHMQQHSGQHLLSAVFEETFGLRTVSFHLGAESSTIDVEGETQGEIMDASIDGGIIQQAERRANSLVFENRPVLVGFEQAAEATGLRKAPDRQGELRIVTIQDLDRSACGGTHVRATGEIGAILIRKLERIRQSVRVEFVCGGRAVRRARADYEALAKTALLFSLPPSEVPAAVAAQMEAARATEKSRRKLELDLAAFRGRELYATTAADQNGVRRIVQRLERANLDELRLIAQNFTAQSNAVFLGAIQDPPSVLLAVSADSGIDAGKVLKAALSAAGGRGGGSARMAQGGVPDPAALERVLAGLI